MISRDSAQQSSTGERSLDAGSFPPRDPSVVTREASTTVESSFLRAARERAAAEGFLVREGVLYFLDPLKPQAAAEPIRYGAFGTSFFGRIEAVGMMPNTHLLLRMEGTWFDVCTAYGQILTSLNVPIVRRAPELTV